MAAKRSTKSFTDRWVAFAPDGTNARELTFTVENGTVQVDHDVLVDMLTRLGLSQSALPDDADTRGTGGPLDETVADPDTPTPPPVTPGT